MENYVEVAAELERRVVRWMARYGIVLLRVSLGIVFFWFGILKFFPNMSPAQDLALRTIHVLTLGMLPGWLTLWVLASWECTIGVGLVCGRFLRATLVLLFLQMGGTMTPMVLFPQEVFISIPFVPTLEGQYIIKNLVLVSAGIVIGATIRGGRIISDPQIAQQDTQSLRALMTDGNINTL